MKNSTFGLLAEYFVIFLYKLKLYKILGRRHKNYFGEIDIIASRGKRLVFIEVKARKKRDFSFADPLVTNKQIERIKKAAEFFLSRNPIYYGYEISFHFVFLKPGYFPLIIKNAF